MARVFLIHGLKFSGKSVLAERLMERHGYVRVKMAAPLKNMVRSLLRDVGLDDEEIERRVEGDLKEDPIPQLGGITSRAMMMTLGEEWRNMHDSKLWAKIGAAKAGKLISEGRDVVVDDIRYPHEIEALSAYPCFRSVVTRGGLHFEPFGDDRHPGERPMPVGGFDYHFRNDFETKDEIWAVLDGVVEALGEFDRRLSSLPAADLVPAAA